MHTKTAATLALVVTANEVNISRVAIAMPNGTRSTVPASCLTPVIE